MLQRVSLEQEPFKFVVDIFGRIVFVGDDLVQHHTPLRLNLAVREGGFQGQLKQQADGLPEVFFEHRCVQDNLFLGGVGVQFSAQPVQVAVDGRCLLTACPAEQRMLNKVRYAGWESRLLGGAAAYG